MAKIISILSILVLLSTEVLCYKGSNCDGLEYAVIALAIVNVFTVLAVVILAVLLYKEQRHKHTIEISEIPKNINRKEYIRQNCGTPISNRCRTPLTRNNSVLSVISEKNDIENIDHTNINQSNINTDNKNINEPKPSISQVKLSAEPIINREQMNAILQGVLSKTKRLQTNSLEDLDKILKENSKLETKISTEKFASTPELDQYDVLPVSVPVKAIRSNDDDDENSLYDTIPNGKDIKKCNFIVFEEGYTLALSKEDLKDKNCYVNAKTMSSLSKEDGNLKKMSSSSNTDIEPISFAEEKFIPLSETENAIKVK